MELIGADARDLPFDDGAFRVIFTSPPWDNLEVLTEARPELTRVLSPKGRMLLLLPHLESPELASLVITNRDWTERQSLAVEAPRRVLGPRYFSPKDEFVAAVLNRYTRPQWRLLDPFCGEGTIPRVAEAMGMTAAGSDIRYLAVPSPANPSWV